MVYAKKRYSKRKPSSGGVKKRMPAKRNTSALTVAKKALRMAKTLTSSTQETKFLSYHQNADLVNNGSGIWGSAVIRELTSFVSTTALFNSDPVTGNKCYLKGCKGTWEIHMDSANNEEETVNFTVAVVGLKKDADLINHADHISTIQGQTYFDPCIFKIHYYRHFVRTMGGTSPGTAGESTRSGTFYIPINKAVRLFAEGVAGAQTNTAPASYQDRLWFCVFTDNSLADGENPRINYRTMLIVKDADVNT